MRWFFILCMIFSLTACGYKGDLYLPKDRDKQQASTPEHYHRSPFITINQS